MGQKEWLLLEAVAEQEDEAEVEALAVEAQEEYLDFLDLKHKYDTTGDAAGVEDVSGRVLDRLIRGYEEYIASKAMAKIGRLAKRALERGDKTFLDTFEMKWGETDEGQKTIHFQGPSPDNEFDLPDLRGEVESLDMSKEITEWIVKNVTDFSIGVTHDVLNMYKMLIDPQRQQYRLDDIVMAMEFADKYFSKMGEFFDYVHQTSDDEEEKNEDR